jgi:glycosyltransferase involved in cell wall biosynthesis
MPIISVILPVFNADSFLKESIDSILHQTFKDFELIILNDGSTDTSLEIINNYTDPRIVLIHDSLNHGLIHRLNQGFTIAKGKYIARMDADDIAYPERLAKQFEFMENNPEIIASGTSAMRFNSSGNIGIWKNPADYEKIKCQFVWVTAIIHPTSIFRADFIKEKNIAYDSQYRHAEDYDLFTNLTMLGKVSNLPDILLRYRVHIKQVSVEQKEKQETKKAEIVIKYLKLSLNFEFEEIEVFIFKKALGFQFTFNKEEILLLEKLYKKILAQNKKIKFFEEYLINEQFAHCFFQIIYHSPKIKKKYLLYAKSILSKYYKPRFPETIKLILKSL